MKKVGRLRINILATFTNVRRMLDGVGAEMLEEGAVKGKSPYTNKRTLK